MCFILFSAVAPPCPRALRSSTPATGRSRTVRNTDPTRRCRSATRRRLLSQGSEAEVEFALAPSMRAHSRLASGAELGRVSPKGGSAFSPNRLSSSEQVGRQVHPSHPAHLPLQACPVLYHNMPPFRSRHFARPSARPRRPPYWAHRAAR